MATVTTPKYWEPQNVNRERVTTRGQQYGLARPRYFKHVQMDLLHRGSFNITDCVRELLNCWEVVKADVVCSRWNTYESVCGVMRYDCHEHHGWVENTEMPLFESFCLNYNQETR